jgi:subtilisin family serine protease
MRSALCTAVALISLAAPRIVPASDVSRQIVVGLARPGATTVALPARLADRLECLGVTLTRSLADGLPTARAGANRTRVHPFEMDPERVWLIEAPDSTSAAAAAAALAHDPDVAWVEPNRVRAPALVTLGPGFPNDPLFRDTRQWGLANAGPAGVYGGIAGADLKALEAWGMCTGSNALRLAVADTGIDPAHPDLALALPGGSARIERGLNVTSERSGSVADSFGHGTLVAGVMAARSGEGPHFDSLGIAGVCGGDGGANIGCRIVPIKIAAGHTGYATSFDIARAILYAVDVGARAVNLSFAGSGPSALERAALYYAVTRGCIVVAASGNLGSATPQYPAAYAADGLCIQVGASDPFDRRVGFSSYGPGLDVVAAGVDVWTTFMTYPSAAGGHYNGYVAAAGTSFAAPFVTGTVGLLAAQRPELTDTDFQRLIREGAHDLGAIGPDAETGWGRLDAAAALRAVAADVGVWHDEVAGERLIACGADTLWVGDPGPGTFDLLHGAHRAERFEVETTVVLPDSFLGPVRVWPRVGGTFTVRAGFRLPYFAPWCEVTDVVAGRFTLRGDLYRVPDDELPAGSIDPWLPVPPDQARFGFTVIGRVDRPPALRVLAPAPGLGAVAGESLAVRWQAADPDTVTAVEIWLDAGDRPSRRLARVPGGARGASIVLPCPGSAGGATALRVVALDEHGRQQDHAECLVPIDLGPGACPEEAPVAALLARPNPFRDRVRFSAPRGDPAGVRLTVTDVAGRTVARVAVDPGSGAAVWDGRDASGRAAPPGLYLVRCEAGGRTWRAKLVKLDGRP